MIQPANGLSASQLKQIRRFAIQFVYQQDANQQLFFQENVFQAFCSQMEVPDDQKSFFHDVAKGVLDKLKELDERIEKNLKNWKFNRVAKVDLAVLRVCAFELMARSDVSLEVIISDAAEIGKQFGSENSGGFINGLLDAIAKDVRKS